MFNPLNQNNTFDRPLWHNGPRPGAFYNFPNSLPIVNDTKAPGAYGQQRPS